MRIKFEPNYYGNAEFKDEDNTLIDFPIGWLYLDGVKGKVKCVGYTKVYEHGYSGGYNEYAFIDAETLELTPLNKETYFDI